MFRKNAFRGLSCVRRIRYVAAIREWMAFKADQKTEDQDVGKIRAARSQHLLPNAWDDYAAYDHQRRSWKNHRETQYDKSRGERCNWCGGVHKENRKNIIYGKKFLKLCNGCYQKIKSQKWIRHLYLSSRKIHDEIQDEQE